MPTTRKDIRDWLEEGKERGATHVIVVCDTFSYEDYPVYVAPNEDVHKKYQEYNGQNMQRVMEVYKLDADWDQLNKHRNFRF